MIESARRRIPSTGALLGFEAVVRTQSVTAAAAELYLTQGAVSRQIAELEAFFGVPLFERRRRRLVLLPDAQQYFHRIKPLLQELEKATLALRAGRDDTMHLDLSVGSTFGNRWLIPRLAGFYTEHPDAVLDISMRIGLPDFGQLRLHAALAYCAAPPAGHRADRVYPLRLLPVCAAALLRGRKPGRGRDLADILSSEPLLEQRTVPHSWTRYLQMAGLQDLRVITGPRFDLLSMGHQAALAGVGIALLPMYVVREDLQRKRLVRLDRRSIETEAAYQLVYSDEHAALPALQRFRGWLLAEAARDAASLD